MDRPILTTGPAATSAPRAAPRPAGAGGGAGAAFLSLMTHERDKGFSAEVSAASVGGGSESDPPITGARKEPPSTVEADDDPAAAEIHADDSPVPADGQPTEPAYSPVADLPNDATESELSAPVQPPWPMGAPQQAVDGVARAGFGSDLLNDSGSDSAPGTIANTVAHDVITGVLGRDAEGRHPGSVPTSGKVVQMPPLPPSATDGPPRSDRQAVAGNPPDLPHPRPVDPAAPTARSVPQDVAADPKRSEAIAQWDRRGEGTSDAAGRVTRLAGISGTTMADGIDERVVVPSSGPVRPTGDSGSGPSAPGPAIWAGSTASALVQAGRKGAEAYEGTMGLSFPKRSGDGGEHASSSRAPRASVELPWDTPLRTLAPTAKPTSSATPEVMTPWHALPDGPRLSAAPQSVAPAMTMPAGTHVPGTGETTMSQLQPLAPVALPKAGGAEDVTGMPGPGLAGPLTMAAVVPVPPTAGVTFGSRLPASGRVDPDAISAVPDALFGPEPRGVQTTTSATPLPQAVPAPPPAAVEQVMRAMTGLGDRAIEIALSPEELGRVRMTLATVDGGLTLTIHAEREDTLALLRRNMDLLGNELRDLGFKNLSFQFSQDGQGRDKSGGSDTPTAASDDMPLENADPAASHQRTANTMPARLDIRL